MAAAPGLVAAPGLAAHAGVSAPGFASTAAGADNLEGVVAISPTDAWAVGQIERNGGPTLTLAEQWTGSVWQAVATPSPGGNTSDAVSDLHAVAATSPTDVWAVGSHTLPAKRQTDTLIEHWDGASWKQVPSFSEAGFSELDAVTAISPTDAWAVGIAEQGDSDAAVIEHWNGASWKHVTSPTPRLSGLDGVVGISANNVWAIGTYIPRGTTVLSLAEHWNGKKWTQVPSANPGGTGRSSLFAMSVAPNGHPWAVGFTDHRNSPALTLAERWNGSKWVQVATPTPGPSPEDQLRGIAAVSPTSAFAVGWVETKSVLAEHWDGKSWTAQHTPALAGTKTAVFSAVAADSASDAWAVGWAVTKSDTLQTLIEHWTGSSWQVATSPNP